VVTSYATPGELRVALTRDPQHPEGTAAELSDVALQQSIDGAGAEIDIRLSGRYTLPFDPVPVVIKPIAVAIAAYLADLSYRQSVDSTAQDPVARRYQWAIDMLSRLASGTATLPELGADVGAFPINPYEGVLYGPDDFGLDTEAHRRTWAAFYSSSPTGRWAGAWD
jgi:phage gp36-like protein